MLKTTALAHRLQGKSLKLPRSRYLVRRLLMTIFAKSYDPFKLKPTSLKPKARNPNAFPNYPRSPFKSSQHFFIRHFATRVEAAPSRSRKRLFGLSDRSLRVASGLDRSWGVIRLYCNGLLRKGFGRLQGFARLETLGIVLSFDCLGFGFQGLGSGNFGGLGLEV